MLLFVTALAGCGPLQQREEEGLIAGLSAAYSDLYASEVKANHAFGVLLVNLSTERGVSALVDEAVEYYTKRSSLHADDVLALVQIAMFVADRGSTEDVGRMYSLLAETYWDIPEMPDAEKMMSYARSTLSKRMIINSPGSSGE